MRQIILTALLTLLITLPLQAFTFKNIDGGIHDLTAWRGKPVLVINTASKCGFTGQYDDLQTLHERYGPKGLVVLTVPSDDFNQEFDTSEEVKEFCALNFALTVPMTDITSVRGQDAHPFYKWVSRTYGFTPNWNFNKILLSSEGDVVATFGSNAKPLDRKITQAIENELDG